MPTWGTIFQELAPLIQAFQLGQPPPGVPAGLHPCDWVRRKYLAGVANYTQRPTILYATKWTQTGGGGNADPEAITISTEDLQGFMEAIHGLPGPNLDLIVHSPGGSPEATDALVSYVRSKFTNVRVFVPHAAMSAATMLACSADEIVLGKHSFLGPVDPQFILQTELGRGAIAATAIEQQFEMAKKEILAQPALLPAWLPMLRQYGPDLLIRCQLARQLSESLVTKWLMLYMFKALPPTQRKKKSADIARQLANHIYWKTHSRFIDRDKIKALGLTVVDLEADQTLQDGVLSVFHSVTHTFNMTPCVKIIENHLGKAFVKQGQQLVMMGQQFPIRVPGPIQIQPPVQPPPGPP